MVGWVLSYREVIILRISVGAQMLSARPFWTRNLGYLSGEVLALNPKPLISGLQPHKEFGDANGIWIGKTALAVRIGSFPE